MPPKPEYFAQFDGDEIDGKFYKIGEPIAEDVDVGTIAFLEQTGRIGLGKPDTSGAIVPPLDEKPVERMTRAELEAAALSTIDLSAYTDDDLRKRVTHHREGGNADDDEGSAQAETPAPAGEGNGEENQGEGNETEFDPAPILSGTVPEVEARLADISDVAQLDKLEAAEVAGQKRAGVGAAIKKRREALQSA